MIDQVNPTRIRITFTIEGIELGRRATTNPKIAKGNMQYPITLIVWKIDLKYKGRSTLCYQAVGS